MCNLPRPLVSSEHISKRVRFEEPGDDSSIESDNTSSEYSSTVDDPEFNSVFDNSGKMASSLTSKASFSPDLMNFLPFIFILPWLLIHLL